MGRAAETLGRWRALTGTLHSATAIAVGAVQTAVMKRTGMEELVRMRPDIGVVLHRNLASGLGERLRRTDWAIWPTRPQEAGVCRGGWKASLGSLRARCR